ncbi:hypothetical protein [Endozoicomonas sp. ALB091]|uniref:hypothetical protein n=1 Tax=Endozoicomonas sp. ALB091 TaxID=3403073 RepID=UPI003BB4EB60
MNNLSARDPVETTIDLGSDDESDVYNAHAAAVSRYQSYLVRPIASTSGNYLSGNPQPVANTDSSGHEYDLPSGFQSHQNQAGSSYQFIINGQTKTFKSLRLLLQIQPFMDNFRASTGRYLSDVHIPPEDSALKTLILENARVQQVFLLVNDIETLNVFTPADQTHVTEQAAASGYRSDDYRLPATHSGLQRMVARENRRLNSISGQITPVQYCQPALSSESSNPAADVNSTTRYFGHINGEDKQFDSIAALLSERKLLRNFRDSAELYNVGSDIPINNTELKHFIINREDRFNAFLLINDITAIPTTNTGYGADHAAAPDAGLVSTIFNPYMVNSNDRRNSIVLHGAVRQMRFIRDFPAGNKSAFKISDAGFYLSLLEKRLLCFTCGGSIKEWQQEWGVRSLDEVHARLYPECSFLREKKGEGFIEACQQQLTQEQQRVLARPLESHPHLYRSPLDVYQWQQEQVEVDYYKFLSDWREGRARLDGMTLHELVRAQNQAGQNSSNRQSQADATSSIKRNVQRCLQAFHRSFLPGSALHNAMDRLHEKVNAAQNQSYVLKLKLLQILQNLLALREDQSEDVGAEIASIIDAAYDRDCQDHTTEIIDQIQTRMALIDINRELEFESDVVHIFNLLKKLKLFYNESVLYSVLSTTRGLTGTLLIAGSESTETRGYIKNLFSQSICQFPENQIPQCYGTVGRPPAIVMAEIKRKFTSGIMNLADFQNYIMDMFNTDPALLNLLITKNAEFSVWHGKTESSAELLMEQYSPDTPGLSEQEIIEGAANVADARARFMREDLYQFISEKLDMFWDKIIRETSR